MLNTIKILTCLCLFAFSALWAKAEVKKNKYLVDDMGLSQYDSSEIYSINDNNVVLGSYVQDQNKIYFLYEHGKLTIIPKAEPQEIGIRHPIGWHTEKIEKLNNKNQVLVQTRHYSLYNWTPEPGSKYSVTDFRLWDVENGWTYIEQTKPERFAPEFHIDFNDDGDILMSHCLIRNGQRINLDFYAERLNKFYYGTPRL